MGTATTYPKPRPSSRDPVRSNCLSGDIWTWYVKNYFLVVSCEQGCRIVFGLMIHF